MRSLSIPLVATLALGALVACGGGGGEQTSDRRSRPADSTPAAGGGAAGGYTVAAVSGGGTVAGKISWQGAPPAPETIEVTKDNAVCGTEKTITKVKADSGGLQGAIVWIDGIASGKDWGAIEGGTVDQRQCEYSPSVQIVRAGNELKIVNSDQVLHNIHAYANNDSETLFNFAQPMQGMTTPRTLEKTGPVHLKCDVHSWMSAWVFVAGHPYYAVTGPDGSFSLGDVPAGNYKVKAWHPVGGEKTADVTVGAGGTADAQFSMP